MSLPAARIFDMTMHGGVVSVGTPNVLVGNMPAAQIGNMHTCPFVTVLVPHVGGAIMLGAFTVLVGGRPQARMTDMCTCVGPPSMIALGSFTTLVGMAGGFVGALGGALGAVTGLVLAAVSEPGQVSKSQSDTELASSPGSSQEQMAARKRVAEEYYKKNCPEMNAADVHSHVKGIDLTKPVEVVKIPPAGGGPGGDQLYQHSFPGKTGQYFSNSPTTTPDQLGINGKVLVPAQGSTPPRIVPREPQSFTSSGTTGLKSTAAPAVDKWSHPGEPRATAGGGTQIMVPRSIQGGLKANK